LYIKSVAKIVMTLTLVRPKGN